MARDKGAKKHPQADKKSWGENKAQVTIMLTPTATAALDARAAKLGISRSELLERIARQEASMSDTGLTIQEMQILGEQFGQLTSRSA